jgi:hypothetical protein
MLLQSTDGVSGWAGEPANEKEKCFRSEPAQKAERTAQSAARFVGRWLTKKFYQDHGFHDSES